ncbi:MAG: tRNA (adenosine(37)-N6)-threonylcarbamoyltransferase complex ATPase subunit type 1 TsaE [Nitrospira sp.]
MKYYSNNLEETGKIAKDFASTLVGFTDRATVVGLSGNLGAGKTTFTQALAKAFGVTETVNSPTFVIEKIYDLENQKFEKLIHIDAYRLESSSELLHLGWKEIISDPKNIILIEWPEKVADIMPEHIKINLKNLEDEGSREIEVVD